MLEFFKNVIEQVWTAGGVVTSAAPALNGTIVDTNGTIVDTNGTIVDTNGTIVDTNGTIVDTNGTIVDTNGTIPFAAPNGAITPPASSSGFLSSAYGVCSEYLDPFVPDSTEGKIIQGACFGTVLVLGGLKLRGMRESRRQAQELAVNTALRTSLGLAADAAIPEAIAALSIDNRRMLNDLRTSLNYTAEQVNAMAVLPAFVGQTNELAQAFVRMRTTAAKQAYMFQLNPTIHADLFAVINAGDSATDVAFRNVANQLAQAGQHAAINQFSVAQLERAKLVSSQPRNAGEQARILVAAARTLEQKAGYFNALFARADVQALAPRVAPR